MARLDVNKIRTMAEPLGYRYTILLDREITDVEDFQEELLTIRQASENDVVHLLLSSCGGSAETMKCILSAIEQCPAHIITEICGDIASAATFIFLSGTEYRVSDNAEAMFHNITYGAWGKGSDVKRQVDFTHKASEKLIRKYYKHMFTDEEINLMLEGREYWLDCDEIISRLEVRQRKLQEEEESASEALVQEQMDLLQGEPIPPEFLTRYDKDFLIKVVSGILTDDEEEKFLEELNAFEQGEVVVEDAIPTFSGYKRFDYDEVDYFVIHADGSITDNFNQLNGETEHGRLNDYFIYLEDTFGEYTQLMAKALGIKFPHNISDGKLKQKIIAKVEEIIDELNS